MDILFEADLRGLDASLLLEQRSAQTQPPISAYSRLLVEGVLAHQDEIDGLISKHAQGWTLPRLPAVDRALLRLAIYEIVYCVDIPDAVAIDEAVELAKSLSTDESPAFVNGVLGAVAGSTMSNSSGTGISDL